MANKYRGLIDTQKEYPGLFVKAYDKESEEALERWGVGSPVVIEKESKRSQKQHRMYWALITLVLDNQDYFKKITFLITLN